MRHNDTRRNDELLSTESSQDRSSARPPAIANRSRWAALLWAFTFAERFWLPSCALAVLRRQLPTVASDCDYRTSLARLPVEAGSKVLRDPGEAMEHL